MIHRAVAQEVGAELVTLAHTTGLGAVVDGGHSATVEGLTVAAGVVAIMVAMVAETIKVDQVIPVAVAPLDSPMTIVGVVSVDCAMPLGESGVGSFTTPMRRR